ncbi:MAG: metallophosphatase family protein [Oligoflexia bacterium]|nr:metallophosphatase family protein [Oligoflexia bacterium]
MRVAFLSDIHGNLPALEAVLRALRNERVDQIVCGGDLVNPLLTSKECWELLRAESIPIIRGNHEDYLVSFHDPKAPGAVRESVQFRPVQQVARHLGAPLAAELARLPLSLEFTPKPGHSLFLCHASPLANHRSFIREPLTGEFAAALERTQAQAIVAGHIHEQWQGGWQSAKGEKLLVVAGSVGLPLMGAPRPQFAILSFDGTHWEAELRSIEYDPEPALEEYRASGALDAGGPIAWLLYDELRTGQKRLSEFIRMTLGLSPRPVTLEEWRELARDYLQRKGTWEAIPLKAR